MASRIQAPEYSTHESNGRPQDGGRGGKWGVIVGVLRAIHVERLAIEAEYEGRIVALDLVLNTDQKFGFKHRLIAVYAPWDPGEHRTALGQFWTYVSALCATASHSWSVIGDCNATMSASETTTVSDGLPPTRMAYLDFLRMSEGYDVWTSQGDAHVPHTYTFANHAVKSILDRLAMSMKGTVAASIRTLHDFIPSTDHLPILASVALAPPISPISSLCLPTQNPSGQYPPRFRYPRRSEKHRFSTFASSVDAAISEQCLSAREVTDDASFDFRYQRLTSIMRECGLHVFDVPKQQPSTTRKLTSPAIRMITSGKCQLLLSALSQCAQYPSVQISLNSGQICQYGSVVLAASGKAGLHLPP
ncbi:hypothetical protein K474DRAFT_1701173 [Panus rudis PR-1116 ss-1]|nr:hypothetical protein K474DRAFT_1701173 [Panus rudis PR-1116 ss-1]